MKIFFAFRLAVAIPFLMWGGEILASRPVVGSESEAQPLGEHVFASSPDLLITGSRAFEGPADDMPRHVNLAGEGLRLAESGALRPKARPAEVPRTRWQHRPDSAIWTRATLSALKAHGAPLVDTVPDDIDGWCPAYAGNSGQKRRAFWVGFMSALAKYESTYKAGAVGGGGKWYGLLQIFPGTARGYQCNATSGDALKSGAANLSCAVRIMAVTVPRDGVIHGPGGRGVAADWAPLRSAAKRAEMAGWLRKQSYCKTVGSTRPQSSPKPRP